MKRYIKANRELTDDIIVTYRNKIIYDGPISADPMEIFKNIRNFNPNFGAEEPKFNVQTLVNDKNSWNIWNEWYERKQDAYLIDSFERFKAQFLDGQRDSLGISYRNATVQIYKKDEFDDSFITPKKRPDPNTAIVDGERMTAEEIADDIMLEADNYEYVYDTYQEYLSDYAKKVIENGWENTGKDEVPYSAVRYVVREYKAQHATRKQNLTSMCYPFIAPLMQEDYDRYKAEYRESLGNEESDM